MYAQVIESWLPHERLTELEDAVRCVLLPALRGDSGFCGALSLVERERGALLLVVFWETEEDAAGQRASAAAASGEALLMLTMRLGSYSVRTWEVNARG